MSFTKLTQEEMIANYKKAFDKFIAHDVENAIDLATMQSYGGDSKVYLEIFPTGKYRIVENPGNRYDSPGIMIKVFPVSENCDLEFDDNGELLAGREYMNAIDDIIDFYKGQMNYIALADNVFA